MSFLESEGWIIDEEPVGRSGFIDYKKDSVLWTAKGTYHMIVSKEEGCVALEFRFRNTDLSTISRNAKKFFGIVDHIRLATYRKNDGELIGIAMYPGTGIPSTIYVPDYEDRSKGIGLIAKYENRIFYLRLLAHV